MHTERPRNLSAVVKVVFDEMPDNPLARERIWLAFILSLIGLLPLGGRPAYHCLLHDLPCVFKATD